MRAIVSWSWGKDSCLACFRAMSQGHEVSHLMHFISGGTKRLIHGHDPRLIRSQSEALGIPLIQRQTTWDTYEAKLKKTLLELKDKSITAAVFGDIDLQEHKDWLDRVCLEVGVQPLLPLWGAEPQQLLKEFLESGFEAVVVGAKAEFFGEEWLGRKLDETFLQYLNKLVDENKVHPSGESGEYHTLVTDGPIFNKRIEVLRSAKRLDNGVWVLDIQQFKLFAK